MQTNALRFVSVAIALRSCVHREGLRLTLQRCPGMQVSAAASRLRDLVGAPEMTDTDVVVACAESPALPRDLVAWSESGANAAVLLLGGATRAEAVANYLSMGAAGYVNKDAPLPELIDAIRVVSNGSLYLPLHLARQVFAQQSDPAHGGGPRLSERETEALHLIALGCSVKEIAARLSLSPATVKSHLHTLRKKMNVTTRVTLIRKAAEQGLISLEPVVD